MRCRWTSLGDDKVMFTVEIDRFRVLCTPDGLPGTYDAYRDRALLVEELALDDGGCRAR